MDDVVLVPKPARAQLNNRQLLNCEEHRRDFVEWLRTEGKDATHGTGYSAANTKLTAYRVDALYRWVWSRHGYTSNIRPTDVDDYVRELVWQDTSDADKGKCVMVYKWVFKWRDIDWGPPVSFSARTSATTLATS